jgi:hypothetical protein
MSPYIVVYFIAGLLSVSVLCQDVPAENSDGSSSSLSSSEESSSSSEVSLSSSEDEPYVDKWYTTGANLTLPVELDDIIPSADPISLVIPSEEVRDTINKSITMKNKILAEIEFLSSVNVFDPSDPGNYEDQIKQRGRLAYTLSVLVFVYTILYSILRFGIGKCGGRKTKLPEKFSRSTKWCPFICQSFGALFFIMFGTVYLIAALNAAGELATTVDIIHKSGLNLLNTTQFVIGNVSDVNLRSLKIPENTINDTRPFHIMENLDLALKEAELAQSATDYFIKFYDEWTPSYRTIPIMMYFFATLLMLGSVLIFKKKLGAGSMISGYLWVFLCILALYLVSGYLYSITLYGDICDQTFDASQTGYIPPYGEGINSFLTCMSSEAQIALGSLQYDMTHGFWAAFTIYKTRFEQLGLNDKYNITKTSDILPGYSSQADTVLLEYGAIIDTLNSTLVELDKLMECNDLLFFIKTNNMNVCYYALNWLYLVLGSLIFLAISFGIMSYGQVSACNVLIRMRDEELNQQNAELIRRANDD